MPILNRRRLRVSSRRRLPEAVKSRNLLTHFDCMETEVSEVSEVSEVGSDFSEFPDVADVAFSALPLDFGDAARRPR